jgi:hypothetical protein
MVFENTVDGGFGKLLKLEEGATLELGRFENKAKVDSTVTPEGQPGNSNSSTEAGEASVHDTSQPKDRKRRFTSTFQFRKRLHGRHVSGPALAVVDADPSPSLSASTDANKKEEDGEAGDEGVKVVIRLAALDTEGKEIGNEQITYLHVVRFGEKVKGEEVNEKDEDKEKDPVEEDKRPWVVKVVKREATIGLHTFHLHEIYGLSSHSTTTTAPSIPMASPPSSTYPPTEPAQSVSEDPSAASECLLCLSSPREVVLLPCRHLVACRECALNMVEFGAGGNITQAAEETTAGGDVAAAAAVPDVAEGGAGTAMPTASGVSTMTTPTAATRRKRKAKGWFCPVCRQPYTSLLRLTTNPPSPANAGEAKDNNGKEVDTEGPATTEVPSSGTTVLGRGRSYGFLRNLSRGGNRSVENSPAPVTASTAPASALPPDVERGAVAA